MNKIYDEKKHGANYKDRLSHKSGAHACVYLPFGDRYIGEWAGDKRDGFGTHYYKKSGNQYIGEFIMDKREGQGTMSIPVDAADINDGTHAIKMRKSYVGSWKNDQKQGEGTFYYVDGSSYEGYF